MTETTKKPAAPPRVLQGMRDFLPERMLLRQWVIGQLRHVFQSFGFEPLETPAVEYAETLKGKYGEEADKLIYDFDDRGGRRVGLRYDLTVPLARVAAMYPELPRPFKRYQIAPVWRAERPQKGRYREFWQCDVDTVGSSSPLADAEVVMVVAAVLPRLGFTNYTIRLNNRKVLTALAETLGVRDEAALALFRSLDKLDKIGVEGVRSELDERGIEKRVADELFEILGVEGTRDDLISALTGRTTQETLDDLRRRFTSSDLALEGIAELEAIVGALGASGVASEAYKVDLSMIRGLDYYTGPIFETVVSEPKIGSISGGGRYDGLIGMFTGRPVPAVGVSVGLERIIDVIEDLGLAPPEVGRTVTQALVTVFGPETQAASLALAAELRQAGLRTEIALGADRIGGQIKYADRRKIPAVLILGPDEIAKGDVVVKDMASGEQLTLPRGQVVQHLCRHYASIT